ncbi:hypothetical protein [Streptomyces clavuligerus]|uniref:Uncharacterized protein n=1 Tax=Streptomyces clavuligerus TaxID=1901 RepID=E2PZX8_STRCL|nr:hypothetical protein [Streptomyces clavuligerus]ANW18899.1 hypothetical protein BB341_11985 [Streptomyces clavuligerus]AXU13475.1 hypothetical protein D1794_12415 [Streptomyces clavuligerus]EFG08397.1 Hypothetical protein SCLAV_3326 [Streptomyces clavuligerus]MBY6303433.1 hypothetical protein [Streptomyces clavuligerus]QCS06258.1 hypothetical protein CRV15_11850 [Streptomyces clavuligerus]
MRLKTSLRISCVPWAAPVAVALSLFYFFYATGIAGDRLYGYAPSLVSAALEVLYAFAYGLAAGLAVWESGRMRAAGVWAMAPVRSRYRVAWNGIAPAVYCAWLLLVLPVTVALVGARTLPTLPGLAPLLLAMVLCVAHGAIGFAVGLFVPRLVAAPVMATAVWLLVAFTVASDAFWKRHVSGQYPTAFEFGEAAAYGSYLPHLLFTGGIAAGVALLWIPLRPRAVRAALALAVMAVLPFIAYQKVKTWGPNPPLLSQQAPLECMGEAPEVCVPETGPTPAREVWKETVQVLGELRCAGGPARPGRIVDRMTDGRAAPPSTRDVWRLHLTYAVGKGELRQRLTEEAAAHGCRRTS